MDREERDGIPKKDLLYHIDEFEERAGPAIVAALMIASAVAIGFAVAGAILAWRALISLIG